MPDIHIRPLALLAAGAVALLSAMPAPAADWQFSATPYLMFPSMDGAAQVGPLQVDVDTSPSDIFSNLNWGAMGLLEAHNGQWGVNLDLTYMNLDATDDRDRGSANGHQGAYAATALYRVAPMVDLYAGVRLNSIGLQLEGFDAIDARIEGSRNRSWVDPLIGARAVIPVSERLELSLLADIGGFGAGSDIAAQFWPTLAWRIGGKTKLTAGYRVIHTDYATGEGASRFVYNITTFGPTLGVNIGF